MQKIEASQLLGHSITCCRQLWPQIFETYPKQRFQLYSKTPQKFCNQVLSGFMYHMIHIFNEWNYTMSLRIQCLFSHIFIHNHICWMINIIVYRYWMVWICLWMVWGEYLLCSMEAINGSNCKLQSAFWNATAMCRINRHKWAYSK